MITELLKQSDAVAAGYSRQRYGRSIRRVLGIGAVALLGSCGTTYEVEKVGKLSADANDPGIYFALPRTIVQIEIALTDTKKSYGRFYSGPEFIPSDDKNPPANGETFKQRFVANKAICEKARAPGEEPKEVSAEHRIFAHTTELTDYAVSTKAVPDFTQIYRLKLDVGPFASYKHTLEFNDRGVIKTADTLVKDGGSAFAQKTIGSLINLATIDVGAAGGVTPPNTWCKDWKDADDIVKTFDAKLAALKEKREKAALGSIATAQGDALTLALAFLDKEIAALQKAKDGADEGFKTSSSKRTFVAFGEIDPANFKDEPAATPKWTVFQARFETPKSDTEIKRIALIQSDATQHFQLASTAENADVKPALDKVKVSVTRPNDSKFDSAEPEKSKGACVETIKIVDTPRGKVPVKSSDCGYRYRFPAPAKVGLTNSDMPIATADVMIAQYGPILSMPASFAGSSAALNLTFSDLGGVTKIVAGSEPQAADAVSSSIDAYGKYRTAELAAAEAAAEKAKKEADAAAVGETTKLKAEKEYLEALKAVRELRALLGITD